MPPGGSDRIRGKQTTPPDGATQSSRSSPAIQSATRARRRRISARVGSRIAARFSRIRSAIHSSTTLPQMLICSFAARNSSCSAGSRVTTQPMRMPGTP